MSSIERAVAIAAKAHEGEKDKANATYLLHPLRVMLALESDQEKIVGVLHDVVEDCPAWTLEKLRGEGFSEEILVALEAVTERPEEEKDYDAFIARAAQNPIARKVKLADLRDNADLTRYDNPQPEHYERTAKYRRAIEYIENLAPGETPSSKGTSE